MAAAMLPNSNLVLFVTHVEAEGPLLKIWGQVDRNAATCIERMILPLTERFVQGLGRPESGTSGVRQGTVCCARFQNDGYYRAEVVTCLQDGRVVTRFIDYGNVEYLPLDDIRLLDGIPNAKPLHSLPPLALDFVLANVLPLNGSSWGNDTVDSIKQSLRYVELQGVVHSLVGNHRLLKLRYNNQDFGDLLVSKNLAVNVNVQEMYSQRQQVPLRRPAMFPTPPREQQTQYPVTKNYTSNPYPQNNYPPPMLHGQGNEVHENWRNPQQPSIPQQSVVSQQPTIPQYRPQPVTPIQEALVFKSRVLDVGSTHDVLISYVEDGPQKFSVQVKNTADILTMLMKGINEYPRQQLQEPPLPGSVCLGRYTQDKILCRAVVMSVMETKCKLYYVDFGHTEVLSYKDIFQLPPIYINPKVLSIRFALSGLKDLNVTEEMKEYFKKLVNGKSLVLQVRPPEGPPLIHYGDLYDNGKNIRDILKEVFQPSIPKLLQEPSHPPKGGNEIVLVSFVESLTKFFVQLESRIESLNSIMACLAEHAPTAAPLKSDQIRVGLPCCALYEVDKQWYRAQVLSIAGDKVKVLYVDYGNEETVTISTLRTIHENLVINLRSQAIKCMLNGYQSEPFDQELANRFELLILEKRLTLVVLDVLPDGLLVDLFDPASSPMVSIRSQLTPSQNVAAENWNSTLNSQNDSKNSNLRSPYGKNQRSDAKMRQTPAAQQQKAKTKNTKATRDDMNEKYNKKNQSDTWNPETSSDWGKNTTKSNWSPNGSGDASLDKSRCKNWKEDENEERRRNNRFDKGGDSDRSGTLRNDRFNRDGPRHDRFGKNDPNDRYERNDTVGSGRGREGRGGGRGGSLRNDNRFEKNGNSEKAWSDKDSDTSSKGSGRRSGRGGRGRGGREGGRGGGGRSQAGKWSDGDSDRGSYKGGRSNGERNAGLKSRDRKPNNSWENHKPSKIGTWDSMSPSSSPKKTLDVPKSQIPSPNITVGAVKNCDIVYIRDPTDFYVQLSPDNLELDKVMENIAATYETGGIELIKSRVQPGTDCVARYAEDLKWYRAVVKANNGTDASVHFIDYGNTESIDFDKIKELKTEFSKLPAQAIHCKLLAASKTAWTVQDIDQFSSMTDGRALEAEFVAQANGVYDVMLREVVDGLPQPTYINEAFSGGADLLQAKQSAKNRGNGCARVPRAPPDYAPISQKWMEPTISPESQEDVMVTWFVNPDNFYCQTISKQAEFRTMMNDLQKVYFGRQPVTDTLEVGTSVIAFFSDDSALYRAEIKELNKLRGHIVQYVDFGNCAMVDARKIYPVERQFMTLPKQAVHCTLRNVAPANGIDWSKANKHEIDKCFDANKYRCTFHAVDDNKYIISLSNNGIDVADSMVEKGLASHPVINSVAVDTAVAGVDNVEDDPDRVDISLLDGQAVRVKISNVEGVSVFHIQLPSATATQQAVTEHVANNDPQVMPLLSCREVCLGAGCLVYSEGVWRRAVVTDCSRTTGFDVRLIDTGAHDEIPLDRMIALPGQLAAKQNQAIRCSLQNAPASLQLDERLKRLIEHKDMIVHVQEVDNNSLVVRLYDTSGTKVKLLETDVDECISPVCPLPVLSSSHKVWVSHVDHSGSIWLQRIVDTDKIATLLEALYEYYSTSGETLSPETGGLCAARGQDQNWYRAKITKVTDGGAIVNFIDYGNSEEVSFDAIKVLEQRFHVPSRLAIDMSLMVVLNGTETEQQGILQSHLSDKEFDATFYNVNKSWVVELIENGQKLSKKFTELGLVKELKRVQPPRAEVPEMVVGGRYDVFLAHSDSPAQFWLQRNEEIVAIENLQADLQAAAPSYRQIDGVPEEGTLCVAVYSADNQWYRAEVLDADEDITTVRFVDYGNTDIIDNKSGNIRHLPESWKSVKKYGIKCRLDVIPVGSEDWNETTCEKFETLAGAAGSPIQALVIADSNPRRVELFVGDKSIGEMLVRDGHAIMVHNAEDLIDEIIDLELDPRSAFVSHVNSPGEFWVQEEKSVSDLELMTDRFIVAEMLPKLDKVKEDSLCVAKFPEDEQWYRARVKSHGDAGVEVIYIDYGNSAVSTEIRAIPEDLAAIPPLSRKCCLPLPEGVKRWSETACEKFVELAADGATIFILDVLREGTTSLVKLTLDGMSIADRLASLCEREPPIIEERLPPLGEENIPYAVVSHLNSPYQFWIQAESNIAKLEVMADRLVEAQSFLPLNTFDVGTICAGKFPEDGQWHRAKILSHSEVGTEVLYIDYGNSAVTTELRILPEDIASLPSLSECCRLRLPEGVDAWPEAACDKFEKLVADGATMFQIEILDTDEPARITLKLEGEDVVDILTPFCGEASRPGAVREASSRETEVEIRKETEREDAHEVLSEDTERAKVKDTEETECIAVQEIQCKDTEKAVVDVAEEHETKVLDQVPSEETKRTELEVTEGHETQVTVVEEKSNNTKVGVTDEPEAKVSMRMPCEDAEKAKVNVTERADVNNAREAIVEAVMGDEYDVPIAESRSIIVQNGNLSSPTSGEVVISDMALTGADSPVANSSLILPTGEIPVASSVVSTGTIGSDSHHDTSCDKPIEGICAVNELTIDDIVGGMVKVAMKDDSVDAIPENIDAVTIVQHETIPQRPIDRNDEHCVDAVPPANTAVPKTPKMHKIVPGSVSRGISEEEIAFNMIERRGSFPLDDKIVPGSINKGKDLTESESFDSSGEEVLCKPSALPQLDLDTVQPSPAKTDHADKIVPGSISRGQSPDVEPERPSTPKTPHSEKLVAGVVNLQESLPDLNEQDEILTIEVEDNIPNYAALNNELN